MKNRTAFRGGVGRDLLEFFLPGSCLGCGDRMILDAWERRVCPSCLLALRPPPAPLCDRCGIPLGTRPPRTDRCEECREWPAILRYSRSAAILESPADRLVHALKYGGWRALGALMGQRMAEVPLPPAVRHPSTVVVPVPTTRTRRRRRGYNQAAILAEAVGAILELPVIRALVRRPGGTTQVALQPMERGRNVLRAFSVGGQSQARRVRGRPVLLVDDVLTTGATAGAAATALASADVAGVTLLTFARALPYRGG
ncbi:MAG: double zinc ribbon domain-containing protein [Longimicrobiales bacterium]|nr:double zinc ribbon domain-containing protein [Longimicrobiales bacterium]